ncbi:MAG TPA: hypothetical protein EYN91_16910 [Candidatus Melainabacteria bacterium]|jgi:hypothetical protein|nr:hypothetical protein [Candidatus Melainabacteria bacterium]
MTNSHLFELLFVLIALAGTVLIPLTRCLIANRFLFKDRRKVGPEYWGELSYGAKIPVEQTIPTHDPHREIENYAGWAR